MTGRERGLKILLRVVGAVMALAIVAVFMPRECMAVCHERLGLGTFPEGPIVEYLARALSGFYAIVGGLFWLVAGDTQRHARVITYVAVTMAVLGVVILVLGIRMGIPVWWVVGDCASCVVFGVAVLVLQARAKA